jgi:hypothetical protein
MLLLPYVIIAPAAHRLWCKVSPFGYLVGHASEEPGATQFFVAVERERGARGRVAGVAQSNRCLKQTSCLLTCVPRTEEEEIFSESVVWHSQSSSTLSESLVTSASPYGSLQVWLTLVFSSEAS